MSYPYTYVPIQTFRARVSLWGLVREAIALVVVAWALGLVIGLSILASRGVF